MGGRGSSSGASGGGSESSRGVNINSGQKAVIDRINQRVSVGQKTPSQFGNGVLLEPIKYEAQTDGTVKYKTKTMSLQQGQKMSTIGVGDIKPKVTIYETTGVIAQDANIKQFKYSYAKTKSTIVEQKTLSEPQYRKYEKKLAKLRK